ncbi:hypothetical protein ElyMa_005250400 [Elysia marginata]|uniref:Uncharacterized protein n=1 Tax=Elysia marginata TaxID=1093978 RepID=A0AAV4JYW3_9GAST|nr:hypothetical protein ElyMa_005250400 [Elysia marginata]
MYHQPVSVMLCVTAAVGFVSTARWAVDPSLSSPRYAGVSSVLKGAEGRLSAVIMDSCPNHPDSDTSVALGFSAPNLPRLLPQKHQIQSHQLTKNHFAFRSDGLR